MTDRPLGRLHDWLADVSGPSWIWHIKYIAANDTYAKSNVHQAGPYVSKELLRVAFPRLAERARRDRNPDLRLPATIDSHGYHRDVRLVWYNTRVIERRDNGRDEARMTGWGGRHAPMVEPDATGSLTVFAFRMGEGRDAEECRIWICRGIDEEETMLGIVGEVEPGQGILWSPGGSLEVGRAGRGTCTLAAEQLPAAWHERFPTAEEIVDWVVRSRPQWNRMAVDSRLTRRRDCEYEVFKSVEAYHVLPRIREGFHSVDQFVEFANSVTNRRKARSGKSLELHARCIFDEERVSYSWTPQTEVKRTPDFIFPSIERYHDPGWPEERLRMLAAKTTCKDRWRQILNEADRIPLKHLLTLQEGVSADQHREMREHNVALVVPRSLLRAYPSEIQPHLMTFEQFVAEVRPLGMGV